MDGEWIPIPMDNWCAQGIPKPVAVLETRAFSLLMPVDDSTDAITVSPSLTVDF